MIIHLSENQKPIDAPKEVYNILKAVLMAEDPIDRDKEHFWVLQLNARNMIQKLELVSLGTLTASLVHPREVFTRVIADRCVSIVLAHNHPSGDCTPSSQDIEVTEQLVEAGKILDIDVVDHVIITDNGFTSFKQEQLL